MDQKKLWNEAHANGKIQHYSNSPTDFAALVVSKIKPKSKILELGCGVGNDSIFFANLGHNIIATDFSEIAISNNKQHFSGKQNLTFQILDMNEPLNFKPNTFDVIYARLSLHYFNNATTQRIFKNINIILKPKGILAFMCKSTSDSLYGKGIKIEDNMFENEGHIRHFFNQKYIEYCLDDKFKIIKLEEKTDILYDKKSSFIEVIAQKN